MDMDRHDCLTEKEYGEALHSLYIRPASDGWPMMEEDIRRAEFYLLIDYRLGKSFPVDRRAALWAVQRDLLRKTKRSFVGHVISRLMKRDDAARLQDALDNALEKFAKLLSDEELHALFCIPDGEEVRLTLPIDPER